MEDNEMGIIDFVWSLHEEEVIRDKRIINKFFIDRLIFRLLHKPFINHYFHKNSCIFANLIDNNLHWDEAYSELLREKRFLAKRCIYGWRVIIDIQDYLDWELKHKVHFDKCSRNVNARIKSLEREIKVSH